MPKYYIKINNDKTIIDSQNITDAILTIISKNIDAYSDSSTIYVSEKGFEYSSWISYKAKNFINKLKDKDVN
jgi:hypothetical protein